MSLMQLANVIHSDKSISAGPSSARFNQIDKITETPLRESMRSSAVRKEKQPVRSIPRSGDYTSAADNRGQLVDGTILLPYSTVEDQPAAERIRMLRARIERLNIGSSRKHVIAVTSAIPGEGKSLTAVNLARALGNDLQRKALLIDCDLRRPNVHNFFNTPAGPGLSDAIVNEVPLFGVIRAVEPGLHVITAGELKVDPVQLVEDPRFVESLHHLAPRYEYIILDCPPVLICPEPMTISTIADGTLVVARSWKTSRNLVNDAVDAIGKKRVLGVVLNDAVEPTGKYEYYAYYDDATGLKKGKKTKKFIALAKRAKVFLASMVQKWHRRKSD